MAKVRADFIRENRCSVLISRRLRPPIFAACSGRRDDLGCGYLTCCSPNDAPLRGRRRTRGREVCRSDARVWRPGWAARLSKDLADDRRDAPDPYRPTALMQTRRSCRLDRWPRGASYIIEGRAKITTPR